MSEAHRPAFSVDAAARLALRDYGISGELTELPSYSDQNFRIETSSGTSHVLKVSNTDETPEALDLQNMALQHLAQGSAPELFPTIGTTSSGGWATTWLDQGRSHLVRLVSYLPGVPIARKPQPSAELLREIGGHVAGMDRTLASFSHPAMGRVFEWDPKNAFVNIGERLPDIADPPRRELVTRMLAECRARLAPLLPRLPMQVIHTDVNEQNLLVGEDGHVSGIIDFGDLVHSYRVCDLAHAAAYLMLGREDQDEVTGELARGYQQRVQLDPEEVLALPDFIRLRLCLSVSMTARQRQLDPNNAYLVVSEEPAWRVLESYGE